MNNILITSAGKRVKLTKLFQKELKTFSPGSKVFSSELNPVLSPAAHVSDGCFKVRRVTADGYVEELLNICTNNDIKVIIPTIDTELFVLSEHRQLFENEGIKIMVSDGGFIKTCRDKRNLNDFFTKHDIRFPQPRDKNNPIFPMFAKPFDGSLSKDLHIIYSSKDFTPEILNNPKLMYMEYIDPTVYKEFTVDMYYGSDNYVKSIVPRERLEIRAGEINKGYTRKNYLVTYLEERIGYLPGVIGSICVQLFYNEVSNDVVGIEINPRFGGGYPLSYYAGANFPAFIIKEYLQGRAIKYSNDWLDNTLMLRYDEEVIVYEKK